MTRTLLATWQFWALLSAFFAALTAILAKVGVAEIHPDVATFVRTIVVIAALAVLLAASGQFDQPVEWPGRALLFLFLSGLATGASWLCYFRALKLGDAARVAPVDKLSIVLVAIFGVIFLGERLSTSAWAGVGLIVAGVLLMTST